ncbi:hypothetical protein ACLK1T_20755 [Escherichia coli]
MKKLRVAACMLMLALAGCDNQTITPTAVKKDAPSEVTKAASPRKREFSKTLRAGETKTGPTECRKVLTLLESL